MKNKKSINNNGVFFFMLIWNILNAAMVIKYSDFLAIMATLMAVCCVVAMCLNEHDNNNDKPFKLW